MVCPMKPQRPLPDVLTLKEAAKYLRLHPSTVYTLSQKKQLPVTKVGGQWRYLKSHLEQWLFHGGNA